MAKKLKSKQNKVDMFGGLKEISFVPTRDIDFTKLGRDNYQDYLDEKEKTIAYEQTFSIVANHLKTINEMASINLPNEIYKVVVEYLLKEFYITLQKHIDK